MYREHPTFAPPLPEAALWRYLTFTKFVSLLDRRAIFFARADKFSDPFEGALPMPNLDLRRQKFKASVEQYPFLNSKKFQLQDVPIKDLRRFTLINCWYEGDHESEAMWSLYSRAQEGIAIRTDFNSLAESLVDDRDIYIGQVSYIDYATDSILDDNLFRPFLNKRKSFEHEREVRALIFELPSHEGSRGDSLDMSQALYSIGTYCKVDLSLLVSEVVVAPYAPDWFLELTKSVADRYCLQAPVNRSSLADEPKWR